MTERVWLEGGTESDWLEGLRPEDVEEGRLAPPLFAETDERSLHRDSSVPRCSVGLDTQPERRRQ